MNDWPGEPWCEDDRLWFLRNKGRRYRIRLAGLDEARILAAGAGVNYDGAPVEGDEYVVVSQIAPGIRNRCIFTGSDFPDLPADALWPSDEEVLRFLEFFGFRFIDPADVGLRRRLDA